MVFLIMIMFLIMTKIIRWFTHLVLKKMHFNNEKIINFLCPLIAHFHPIFSICYSFWSILKLTKLKNIVRIYFITWIFKISSWTLHSIYEIMFPFSVSKLPQSRIQFSGDYSIRNLVLVPEEKQHYSKACSLDTKEICKCKT